MTFPLRITLSTDDLNFLVNGDTTSEQKAPLGVLCGSCRPSTMNTIQHIWLVPPGRVRIHHRCPNCGKEAETTLDLFKERELYERCSYLAELNAYR